MRYLITRTNLDQLNCLDVVAESEEMNMVGLGLRQV